MGRHSREPIPPLKIFRHQDQGILPLKGSLALMTDGCCLGRGRSPLTSRMGYSLSSFTQIPRYLTQKVNIGWVGLGPSFQGGSDPRERRAKVAESFSYVKVSAIATWHPPPPGIYSRDLPDDVGVGELLQQADLAHNPFLVGIVLVNLDHHGLCPRTRSNLPEAGEEGWCESRQAQIKSQLRPPSGTPTQV